jgi:opacity protein-like surface antigen
MTENQFDELFRKKLGSHESPVPEDMWRRIKQRKDKERRPLLILLLLLLVAGGTAGYFIFEGILSSKKESITLSQKETKPDSNNTIQNKTQKNETITTQKKSIELSQKNKVSSLDNNGEEKAGKTSSKNNTTLNKSSSPKTVNTIIEHQIKKEVQDADIVNKTSEDVTRKQDTEISQQNSEQEKNNRSNEIAKSNEPAITQQNNQTNLLQKDASQEKLQTASKEITIKIHSPIIKNILIEAYGSPDIPLSKTSSNNANYLRQKDSTSEMKLSYTFGIRAGVTVGKHFLLKTGIQYSDISEKFNYLNKNATRTVPVVVTRTLTNTSGETIMFRDTSNFIQAGKDYKHSSNHYKSIDVPILVGYETGGERLKTSFNTGVILNIRTSYKGDILDASLNAADINTSHVYKSNTGMSLYFGLGVSTKVNNNLRLFTEPYIRYRLSSMTGALQPFSQKINVGGLSLGLRYNF